MRWTDAAVREALDLPAGSAGAAGIEYSEISTDTRTMGPGALFVALEGANFNGHDFLDEAAARGARGVVIKRESDRATGDMGVYRVGETLEAYGRLARYYRNETGARVCAITGTNGKTTTKEMIRAVLSTRWRVHATSQNLNNLVGVPKTLLATPSEAEVIVVELGTNAPGEIARLGAIAEPDAAIITNVAEGHLEGLTDLPGVLREKVSLLDALGADGLAFVGEDPPELAERARDHAANVHVAGWSQRADPEVRASDVRLDEEGRVRFEWNSRQVRLDLRGRANARNALLALAVGQAWDADADAAVETLGSLEPVAMRGQLVHYGDLTVIADCYNANPGSMAAAVDLLASLPRGGGRVAVVGTMRELGPSSVALHRRVARELMDSDVDTIVATGEFVPAFEPFAAELDDRLIAVHDPMAAYERLRPRLRGDEVLLLKASRGEALERLLPRLEAEV